MSLLRSILARLLGRAPTEGPASPGPEHRKKRKRPAQQPTDPVSQLRRGYGQLPSRALEEIVASSDSIMAREVAANLLAERAQPKQKSGSTTSERRRREIRDELRRGGGQSSSRSGAGAPEPQPPSVEDEPAFKQLVAAARAGNAAEVKACLAATPFDAYALGSALYWTLTKYGSPEPSPVRIEGGKALIDGGADVNHRMKTYGDTAIGSAVLGNDADVAEFLVASGANPLRRQGSLSNQTPLERAIALGNPAIVAALQRARPILSADDFIEAARNGATGIVQAALDAGIAVDFRDERGYSAPLRAAAAGQAPTVRLLLARGAPPNSTSDDGAETALTAAVVGRSLECVELLVSAGADLGLRRTYDNGTPLGVAEWLGCSDIASLLRERGASTSA